MLPGHLYILVLKVIVETFYFNSLYAPFLKERPLISQLCEFLYLRNLICSDVADTTHTAWQPASLGPHLLVHSDRNLQIEIRWEKVAGRSQKQKFWIWIYILKMMSRQCTKQSKHPDMIQTMWVEVYSIWKF